MKNAVTRACAWVSLALMTYAPLAAAQTLEIYAGGGHFVDIPGNTIGLQPGAIAAAPDGFVYLNDINGRLMRINSATGLVTALPATPGGIAYNIGYSYTVAVDYSGRAHVYSNGRLMRIESNGTLTDAGPLSYSGESAFAPDGSLYIAPGDQRIYVRFPGGQTEIFAGLETAGFSGDGGPAANAEFNNPQGVAVAPNGDVYVADSANNRIRRISGGIITTFAGTGSGGFIPGLDRTQSNIPSPYGLAFDAAGNLLVSTYFGGLILRIDAVSGLVTKIGGGGSGGDGGPAVNASMSPKLITVAPDGNIYFSDSSGSYQKIRKIDASNGIVSLAVGYNSSLYCGENIPARQVCLGQPIGLDIDLAGDLVFTDPVYSSIRKVAAGTTILSTWKTTTESPIGIEHDAAGNTYVASFGGYQVNRYDAVTGAKTVVAGRGSYGFGGDGGPATLASLASPLDVALDPDGNLYITDVGNNRIRKVTASTGIIGTLATIGSPSTIELEPAGTLLVSGSGCTISRVNRVTGATTRIAGTGTCAYPDPPGGTPAASTALPNGITFAVAPDGNIYLGGSTPQLYKIDAASGVLTRVPAPATGLKTPEGIGIRAADRMEFDSAGNLYISQENFPDQYIFKVSGLVDPTPPSVEPVINGVPGNNGWYLGNVQVTWVVSDPESAVTSQSGCGNSSVTSDTSGVTFTCTATSSGGTRSQSITIKRDTQAPYVTFGSLSPEPDAAGWNSDDVTIPYTTSDSLSGVYSSDSPNPLVVTGEGNALGVPVVVTDFAGNSMTFLSPPVRIDRTPPSIIPTITGPPGNNGWYKGDVHLTWSAPDGQSELHSYDCPEQTVTADTAGVTFTCTATSAGGTATGSVTIKRDATPPVLTWGAPNPAPNAAGWNTTDVSFAFTTDDATSGVGGTSHPSPALVPFDGPGVTTQITVWDNAGNSTTVSTPPVNIDRSEPIVNYTVTGTPGDNGWYTSDAQVTWQIVKAPESILSQTGCVNTAITVDTAGTTLSCSVTSGAGTTSRSVIVKRDATPPTLSWGAFSPAPNANGWNKTNVTVPFTIADATSGIASSSATSPLAMSVEGEGVTGQVTVTDNAGNSKTFATNPRNIDKTAPVVSITTPANGATYGFYQDVFADFACADISLLSCSGTNAEGAAVNTRIAGPRTFKVTAKDSVAFTTSVTNTFNVASTFNFDGFIGAAPSPAPNIVRKGSLVPIRWRLPDGNGGYVTSTASFSSVATTTVSCPAGAVTYNDTATGGSGISFNAATNAFTYNWQSSSSFTGCKQIFITLKDGSQRDLVFKFQ